MYKVLLDENLPVKIKFRLQDVCDIFTVKDMDWNALENGDLINAMEKDGFDFLITSDKNLQYQQNLAARRISIIVLTTTSWPRIQKRLGDVVSAIASAIPCGHIEITIP